MALDLPAAHSCARQAKKETRMAGEKRSPRHPAWGAWQAKNEAGAGPGDDGHQAGTEFNHETGSIH